MDKSVRFIQGVEFYFDCVCCVNDEWVACVFACLCDNGCCKVCVDVGTEVDIAVVANEGATVVSLRCNCVCV